MLRQHGAREVVVAPAYRTMIPAGAAADAERMRALIAAGSIDLVTFTSSSTVTNFAAITGVPSAGIKAAAIGPITAETARELGFEVVVAPTAYTVEALIAAIASITLGSREVSLAAVSRAGASLIQSSAVQQAGALSYGLGGNI